MDPRARFEETLRKFGNQIGEVLELDEEGACVWDLGEDRECLVVMPEHAEAVVFCVNVAPVISDAPERLFRHLLIIGPPMVLRLPTSNIWSVTLVASRKTWGPHSLLGNKINKQRSTLRIS